MGLQEAFEDKKEWRALQKRAAALPKDYSIVYKEIQKYLLKVNPINLTDDLRPLTELLDLFEAGAKREEDVLKVTGEDVAAFADGLIEEEKTFIDEIQERMDKEMGKSMGD